MAKNLDSYIHSPAPLLGMIGELNLPLHATVIDSAGEDGKGAIVSRYTGQYFINLGVDPHIDWADIAAAVKGSYGWHHLGDACIKSSYIIRYKRHIYSPNQKIENMFVKCMYMIRPLN